MAESQKRSSAAVHSKEETMSLDLDFGKDFLSSWKSMSVAEDDAMDFDLTPVSKGKNKSFDFGKADMDFNLDGDFGKMPNFNMDMSDLDISPPLKKDGASKENSKEFSGNDKGKTDRFNMDMSDLDICPPFKKDGTSKEKSKEPSGNDKGKTDRFNMDMSDLDISPPLKKDGTSKENSKEFSGNDKGKTDSFFAFDFDDMENFSFDSRSTKEAPKAQKQNDNIESSPTGSESPEMEGSSLMNLVGDMSTIEDVPQKQSLPGNMITADVGCQDGRSSDLEITTRNDLLKLSMDDSVASKCAVAALEISSEKTNTSSDTIIASTELPKNCRSKKSVSAEPVDVKACTEKDADVDLSPNSLSDNEPSAGNSSGLPNRVDFLNKDATGSIQEQDVNYSHTVAISEKNNAEKSQHGIENYVKENEERKNSGVGMFNELSTGKEKQEPASEILKLPSARSDDISPLCIDPVNSSDKLSDKRTGGLPSDKSSDKETEKGKESSVTCLKTSIQTEKAKCPAQKAPSTQTTDPSLSSKKKSFAQPILDECRRDWNSISNRKQVSLPSQQSKTLLRMELPQIQIQESSKNIKSCGEVNDTSKEQNEKKLNDSFTKQNLDVLRGKSPLRQSETSMKDLHTLREVNDTSGEQNGKKSNDSFATQNLDVLRGKSPLRQREMSMKDLGTLSSRATLSSLSMDINKKTAQRSKIPVTLASLPSTKNTPVEEKKLSSCEGSRKTTDFHSPKLSSLKLDSTKSPSQKDMKSLGDISQNRASLRNSPTIIAHFADSQKETPPTQSLKRKTLQEHNADNVGLYPSKRCASKSPLGSRNFVDSSERSVLEKMVSNKNNVEDGCNKSTLGNRQLYTIDVLHKENVKGLEISSFVDNESHIKQAEGYNKELDDICNMLRKKREEAKELLVRATVNNNKLLMLNHPLLQEKIHAIQNSFATLTLNNVRA